MVISTKLQFDAIQNPELIFGLVGPIGVDLDLVVEALELALRNVKYAPKLIHVTQIMRNKKVNATIDESTYFKKYTTLIRFANAYRKTAGHAGALAARSIIEIRRIRTTITKDRKAPALGTAYIVRQFKRPEEIELMRRVYGRKFVQVSVFGSATERKKKIEEKIRLHSLSPKSDIEVDEQSSKLIDIDHNQKDDYGQQISDVFHLGDVFVRGIDKAEIDKTVTRFVNALFGHNGISPNRDEYGLYAAAAASLRSIDLSRQIGAAIFSLTGEVTSLGCNEVPKAKGGTYWEDGGTSSYRDFEIGRDTNHIRKAEILFEFTSIMSSQGMLNKQLSKGTDDERYKTIAANSKVKESQLMDIIEFGRMIHAEMSAISDAARLGRATLGTTLFTTAFPCHICAKHIVAAGISRVVFLEPYPKSYAERLHSDSITFEPSDKSKVLFEPFIGISPRRYRDIFEKKRRKDNKSGKALPWYKGKPSPMIDDSSPAYISNEEIAGRFLSGLGKSAPEKK